MIFKNKKVNIFIFFTLALICVAVVLPTINLEIVKSPVADASTEDTVDNPGSSDSNISESFEGMPKLTSQFRNAWTAYNYAVKMSETYPAYMAYTQNINATALDTVTVKVSVSRTIINNLNQIYAINNSRTEIDASKVGIDLSGKARNYIAYTHFDFVNDHVQGLGYSEGTIENYKKNHNGVMLHTLPYIINSDTVAKTNLKNDPSVDYYTVTLTLNSKAWKTYTEVIKTEIGKESVTSGPYINSIDVVCKIDKTYGTFKSITSTEKYKLEYTVAAGISAEVECTGGITLTYNYKKDLTDLINQYHSKIYK